MLIQLICTKIIRKLSMEPLMLNTVTECVRYCLIKKCTLFWDSLIYSVTIIVEFFIYVLFRFIQNLPDTEVSIYGSYLMFDFYFSLFVFYTWNKSLKNNKHSTFKIKILLNYTCHLNSFTYWHIYKPLVSKKDTLFSNTYTWLLFSPSRTTT